MNCNICGSLLKEENKYVECIKCGTFTRVEIHEMVKQCKDDTTKIKAEVKGFFASLRKN